MSVTVSNIWGGKVVKPDTGSTLLKGIVGYWKLDETSGTDLTDATGNKNMTTNATVNADGKIGRAVSPANNQTINLADDAVCNFNNNELSVSLWYFFTQTPMTKGELVNLFNARNTAPSNVNISVRHKNLDNKMDITIDNTDLTAYWSETAAFDQINTWHHLVFTFGGNNTTMGIYHNGSSIRTGGTTFLGTINTSNVADFGNYATGQPYNINGRLDEIGLWHKVLTSDEILELYNSGNGKSYPFV